jgi:sugar lactone lactonase YvrE
MTTVRRHLRLAIIGIATAFLLTARLPLRADALGTTNILVGPLTGTNSVVLAASGAWTASAQASWLRLDASNQSGTGSTNVIFSFDANPGLTRTGTLTIDGLTLTVTQAGATYVPTMNPIPIVSSGLLSPNAVAVDGQGNVYFTDSDYNAAYMWQAGTTNVTTLVNRGLSSANSVAAQGPNTVYIADSQNGAVYAWHPGDPTNVTTASLSYFSPFGLAVDGSGGVLIADATHVAVKKWQPPSQSLTTLVTQGLTGPAGVAVDVAGNVYIADILAGAVGVWQPGTSSAITLFQLSYARAVAVDGSGCVYAVGNTADAIFVWRPFQPQDSAVLAVGSTGYGGAGGVYGVAVDGAGTVYFSDGGNASIMALPNAFVDPTPISESGGPGMGALPPVIPSTMALTGPFQPTSDQPWLTIVGSANGVVSYRLDANFGTSPRTANIRLLGQVVPVTQDVAQTTFELGRASALVGPHAGRDSVVLGSSQAGAPWAASTTASWLHLDASNQSGAGSTNVIFSYDANPGPTRTGALTIAGLTLTVTQAGTNYVAARPLTTLATGLSAPSSVAVDELGSVYFADTGNHAIKQWQPTSQSATTLVSTNLTSPNWIAVDGEGNVFFTDFESDHSKLKEWLVTSSTLVTLVDNGTNQLKGLAVDEVGDVYFAANFGLIYGVLNKWQVASSNTTPILDYNNLATPGGVALDAAGNLYVVETLGNRIKVFRAGGASSAVLVSSPSQPTGVAVDGAGNVFFTDYANNAIKVWKPTDATTEVVVNSGLSYPQGVAVDGAGNVYIADTGSGAIKELPYAFVDPTPIVELNMAGSGSLPAVLPTTANLSGAFNPTNGGVDWLTITGTTGGVVSYSFTENTTGSDRTATITVLGQSITITQTGRPAVATQAASNVGPFAAALAATVNPVGAETSYWFEYGATTAYGSVTPTSTLTPGTAAVAVTNSLDDLASGQTYHFRIVASNASGTNWGADRTFSTLAVPASLGTTSLVVGPSAGSDGVILIGRGSWTTTANASWLHFGSSQTPGRGQTNITFTYDANPGAPRTGTLTIGGQEVTVTQAGAGSVPAGPVMLFQSSVAPGSLAVTFPNLILGGEGEDRIWQADLAGGLSLVKSGLANLKFVSADGGGSIYFYDYGSSTVGSWSSGTGTSQLLGGAVQGAGPAVDPYGNVYFIAPSARTIYSGNALALTPVGSYPSGDPFALAVDAAGNLYFTDTSANAIQRLVATNFALSALVSNCPTNTDGSSSLWGLAVNGSGDVYYGADQSLWHYHAASQTSSRVAAAGAKVFGVAVDAAGNVYYTTAPPPGADPRSTRSAVFQLPRAWMGPPPNSVVPSVGASGSLQVVASAFNPAGPGAPVSDQPWLTINGAANGVVNYAILSNDSGAARVAHVTVLGRTFEVTQTSVPTAATQAATLAGLTATLSAFVNPEGAATDYWFEYGTSTNYGSSTATNTIAAGTRGVGATGQSIVLALNTTYHFRIVAMNGDGRTNSQDMTFTTPPAIVPLVTMQAASNVNQNSATLTATLNPGGSVTTYYFEYGWTTFYGNQTAATTTSTSDSAEISVTAPLNGLRPGRQYHFRLVASNSLGTKRGTDMMFTTSPSALATSSLLVSPSAGSDSVALAIGGLNPAPGGGMLPPPPGEPWTASTTATWLHIHPEHRTGIGSTNLVFTFDANPGPTRSDTITIAGETLTITQAGSSYVAARTLTPLVTSGLSSPSGIEVDGEGNVIVADTGNNAVKIWQPSSQSLVTLVSEGLSSPSGVAVDVLGNVFIADRDNGVVKQWNAASQTATNLLSDGLNAPHDVAVDRMGSVYVADFANAAIKHLSAGSQTVGTLVDGDRGLTGPMGVAVDAAGNLYMADTNHSIMVWNRESQTLSTLVPSLAVAPRSVAVDVSGNVYFPDHASAAINVWSAASQSVTTLVAAGLTSPSGVAVDGARNLFVSDAATGKIHELPLAFVDTTPQVVPGMPGTVALPSVLPVDANLSGPFTPTSDQPWLTIHGATNGVVIFSYLENTSGVERFAHISVLGHSIAVMQSPQTPAIRPVIRSSGGLGGGALPGTPGGSFGFEFTGTPGAPYGVLSTTDLTLPINQWRDLGIATEVPAGSGNYRFLDAEATDAVRYYILVNR